MVRLIKKETGLEEVPIEIPPDPKFGDFSFPCFILSHKLKKAPHEIANDLSTKIKPNEFVKEVKAAGPYLNFFMNNAKLAELTIFKILKGKDKYGSSNTGKGKTALIEHTSINPNAEPHVGRLRNALIGDSVTKIFKFQGYKTDVHYWVNDVGKQIAMLVMACKGKKPSFKQLLSLYVGINKKISEKPELEKEVFGLLYKLENGDKKVRKQFETVVDICIQGQKKILAELGIRYDHYDYESKYLWSKKTKEILDRLIKKESCFKDSDGRIVINQEELKVEMKSPYLVLTRSDGTSLYPLRDLAYTIEKMEKSHRNIVVLGEDQKLYFKQLALVLKLLGYDVPEVVHYSFVLLKTGKMSTRKGEVVLLTDFMRESVEKANSEIKKRKNIKRGKDIAKIIGFGALKYSILRVSPEKNVTFDWDTALSFEGEAGPYIQYAYARAASILRKAKLEIKKVNYSLLGTPEETNLVKELASFPDIISKAEADLRPHLISTYVFSLAKVFNEFYHACQCIIDDKELSRSRLSLVLSTRIVLKNGLALLGIMAPESM